MIFIKFYRIFPVPLFSRHVQSYEMGHAGAPSLVSAQDSFNKSHVQTFCHLHTIVFRLFASVKTSSFSREDAIPFRNVTSADCCRAHGRSLFSVTFTDPTPATHEEPKAHCWQAGLQPHTENLREHQVSPGHRARERGCKLHALVDVSKQPLGHAGE